MNKNKYKISIILIILIAIVCMCSACNGNARSFSFTQDSYTIFADEQMQFKLDVNIKPTSAEYTLASSNEKIVEVLDDGVTLRVVSYPGIVTITGTSGDQTATCLVQTIATNGSGSGDSGDTNDTYTITFKLEYGSVPDQYVAPSGLAKVPEVAEYMGQVVGGWYLDKDYKEVYDFKSPVVKDLTLYAKFVSSSEPEFLYKTINSKAYITGFRYSLVDYGHVTLPTTDTMGRTIYGIMEEAFGGCTTLTSITIPASYVDIQKKAFISCTNLVSVTFDDNSQLTTLGESAFEQCKALTTIDLPSSLVMENGTDTAVGEKIFALCTALESITLPSSIKVITNQMFAESGLISFDLSNITYIGFQAFLDAKDFESATNTANITDIRGEAFKGTKMLDDMLYKSTTNTAYLDDILLYTTLKNGNTIAIPQNIRLVASLAVYDTAVSKVEYVQLESDTPITLCKYAIGAHVDLIVPESAVDTYVTAWPSYETQIFYKDTIDMTAGGYDNSKASNGTLDILIRQDNSSATAEEWVVTISKYITTDATFVDTYGAIYDKFGYYVRINNIQTYAFYKAPTLNHIYIPAYVTHISMNAFNILSGLTLIQLEGWNSSTIASGVKLESSAINPLHDNFNIYVQKQYLGKYTSSSSDFYSMTKHFKTYEPTQHTVDFVATGYKGTFVTKQLISNKGTVTTPNTDVYKDITFHGWYTDEACTIAYDFTTEVTTSFTLYAKFDLVTND